VTRALRELDVQPAVCSSGGGSDAGREHGYMSTCSGGQVKSGGEFDRQSRTFAWRSTHPACTSAVSEKSAHTGRRTRVQAQCSAISALNAVGRHVYVLVRVCTV
jgi:hypothetical protein